MLTVLLLEDDKVSEIVFRRVFDKVAESYALDLIKVDTLDSARVKYPLADILVLDLHVPGAVPENIFQFAEEVNLPWLAYSATDDPALLMRAGQAGCSGFLQKGSVTENTMMQALLCSIGHTVPGTRKSEALHRLHQLEHQLKSEAPADSEQLRRLGELAAKMDAETLEGQRRESIWRALFDQADFAIVFCDMNGAYLNFNKQALELCGVAVVSDVPRAQWAEHFVCRHLDDSMYSEDELPLVRALQGFITDKFQMLVGENRTRIVGNARPIVAANGQQLGGFVCFQSDTD